MASKNPRKKRKPDAPVFDPVAEVVRLLGSGRFLQSEIMELVQKHCARAGVKPPGKIALGKRMAALSESVTRERVYSIGAAAR